MIQKPSLRGIFLVLTLAGCVTPAEEKQIKDDIFSLQSRLLQMEGQLSNQGKEISTQSSRQEASISTRLDKFAIEIQRVKGEIDALRVGITTGQMPGADGTTQENPMAKQIVELSARLDAIEENQAKIVAAIDKAIDTKKPEKRDSSKDKKKNEEARLKTFKDLKAAYDDKEFKLITEEGEKVVNSLKGKKNKQEALFMLGESYYRNGQARDAALRFNDFIESKPSDNLPLALMRMGDCFKQLGDVETAKIYYQELIQKHSRTDEAKQAKEKLGKL